MLGQQVSIVAAKAHGARLVADFGEPITDPTGKLTHLFPTPEALTAARFAMPASRQRTLAALINALAARELKLGPGSNRQQALATLKRLPGIGPWTTEIIAMRALGDPDAFPTNDLGVRRGASGLGLPTAPAALTARSDEWRPWRAYAVQHLWAQNNYPINHWPAEPRAATASQSDSQTKRKRALTTTRERSR